MTYQEIQRREYGLHWPSFPLERDSCDLIYLVFMCLCRHTDLKTDTVLSVICDFDSLNATIHFLSAWSSCCTWNCAHPGL